MAYLSRIWLNPLRHQSRRLINDPQALHAAILGGLPTQPVRERVLWRLDIDEPRRPSLFVLTRSRPSWEHLVEQAGWPSAEDPQAVTRPYQPLLEQVVNGRRFAFRLTANPVRSTRQPDKLTASQRERSDGGELKRSARVGHRTVQHQLGWLLDRTGGWGFEIPAASSSGPTEDQSVQSVADVRISARERRTFRRGKGRRDGPESAPRVVLQVVTYDGQLQVTDAEALREQLLTGFGPAKAYGCGLLTLAPLTSGHRPES